MDANFIVAESVAKFKQTLEAVCEKAAGKPLSADGFSEFIGGTSGRPRAGGAGGKTVCPRN